MKKTKKSVLVVLTIAIIVVCLSQSVFAVSSKIYTTQGPHTEKVYYSGHAYDFITGFCRSGNEYYVTGRINNHMHPLNNEVKNLKLVLYKRVYRTINGYGGYFEWVKVKSYSKDFNNLVHQVKFEYGWTTIGYYGYRIDAYANNTLVGRHYRYL